MADNTLYYGDNLDILRDRIATESVDLVYLDPPFNSNRSYNVLFRNESGSESDAQIHAFEDTWHWTLDGTEVTYSQLVTKAPDHIAAMIAAMRRFIGPNQMMAYLVMMTARLVELHRVLKPTGSLYLHCDPTASHYLKVILDTIFGPENFRNEIAWKRSGSHNDSATRFGWVKDTVLFYTKSDTYTFNMQYVEHSPDYLEAFFRHVDAGGRRFKLDSIISPNPRPNLMYDYKGYPHPPRGWSVSLEKMEQLDRAGRLWFPQSPTGRIMKKVYLDELPGMPCSDVWTDIKGLAFQTKERLGYPTQKPLALLERIITASSNPGDVVLDPFCGCGTAIAAAQKLGRRWIGIDITNLSISLMAYRLNKMFPSITYEVHGEPKDMDGAKDLAARDRYQFQWWALWLIKAQPLGGQEGSRTGKKGSDGGIDGVIAFVDDSSGQRKRVIVQVKSGHVKSGDIRDLKGTMQREQAPIGVFITLEEPSRDMLTEAATASFYHSPGWNKEYPALQVLTIADLLSGRARIQMPPEHGTFKQAERVKAEAEATQRSLLDDVG